MSKSVTYHQHQCETCGKHWALEAVVSARECPYCESARVRPEVWDPKQPLLRVLHVCRQCGHGFAGVTPETCPACGSRQPGWDSRVCYRKGTVYDSVPQQPFAVDRYGAVIVVQPDGSVKLSVPTPGFSDRVILAAYDQIRSWNDIVSVIVGDSGVFGITWDGKLRIGYMMDDLDSDDTVECGEFIGMETGEWKPVVAGVENNGLVCITTDGEVRSSSAVEDEIFFDPDEWDDITSVCMDDDRNILGVRADGTVVSTSVWDDLEDIFDETGSWEGVVSVRLGTGLFRHAIGLTLDGRVLAAGSDELGQCSTSAWRSIVQIEAGDDYSLGLRADGTVVAAGNRLKGRCDVEGWHDVIAIAAKGRTSYGLCKDGSVLCTDRTRTIRF